TRVPPSAATPTLGGMMLKRFLISILGMGVLVGCGSSESGAPIDGNQLGGASGSEASGGSTTSGGSGGTQNGSGGTGDDSGCDDGASRKVNCGTNGNGFQLQECVEGQWVDQEDGNVPLRVYL